MTTARELAAYGLPSEAEVDAMRRRLTDAERAGALWGRPDPFAERIPLDDLPDPSGMTEAARLYCVEETWRQGYLPAHVRRPRGRAPDDPRLGGRRRALLWGRPIRNPEAPSRPAWYAGPATRPATGAPGGARE